jgi:hypothetical protein
MRVLVAIGAVVLSGLAGAASAAAAAALPPSPAKLPIIQLDRGKNEQQKSCTAQTKGKIMRAHRKLVPVACEQPPRSRVRDAGFVITLAP